MPSLPFARGIALTLFLSAPAFAAWPAAAQTPTKTFHVELDAEKDYFAPGTVRVVAVSRKAGQVEVGELDVTIRRRREISVPADASELIFRIGKDIAARLKLSSGSGTIVVRPLAKSSSFSDIGWALGIRKGIAVERLSVEFKGL